jgi:hypothetical protein
MHSLGLVSMPRRYADYPAQFTDFNLDCHLVERVEAGKIERTQLAPRSTRIVVPKRCQDLIDLRDSSRKIGVGQLIPAAKRRRFAEELRREWRVCGETGVQAQVVSMAESGNPL